MEESLHKFFQVRREAINNYVSLVAYFSMCFSVKWLQVSLPCQDVEASWTDAEICDYYEVGLVVNYFKEDLWSNTATMRWIKKLMPVAQL